MPPQTKTKVVAMIVGSAIIMQQIDSTVITTALPQMAISLHTDPLHLSVAVTATESRTGSVCSEIAICGSAVVITVESSCCMITAEPTIIATILGLASGDIG